MEFNLESVSYVFCLIVFIITVLYYYGTVNFNYWKDRGVAYIKPIPFIGTSQNLIIPKRNIGDEVISIYNEFKNERFVGTYTFQTPTLFLRDPVLINQMLTSDFIHFHDKAGFVKNDKLNPLNSNLLNLTGTQWKTLRNKLSPVFSSGKLKTMMDQVELCAKDLVSFLDGKLVDNQELDMRQVMGQFTTKVIGSVAFGCELDTLNDPDSEFMKYGSRLFTSTFRSKISSFMSSFCPKLIDILGVKAMLPSVESFYLNFVKESVAYREKNNYQRNDILQLLINLRKEDASGESKYLKNKYTENSVEGNKIEDKPTILDDTMMAANVYIFFIAGFETTATTLSLCLFELAMNQDIQQKLRVEILGAMKKEDTLSYEAIKNMKYMQQVISETLRKYSVVFFVTRRCTKKYKIPDTDVIIDEGTRVIIPIYASHRDPQYYPEPEKFDPERFSEENIKNIQNGTYLPFGGGPRICIGLRFALLEIKIALAHVLSRYQFSKSDKMVSPIEYSKTHFLISPKDGVWLKISKL